jgi:hypothetical protein
MRYILSIKSSAAAIFSGARNAEVLTSAQRGQLNPASIFKIVLTCRFCRLRYRQLFPQNNSGIN